MGRRRGFSLIEALVALAILTMALLSLYELQQRLTHGERRSEAALTRAALQRNAVVILADLNPMEQPSGSFPLAGGRSLRWRSVPLTRAKPNQPLLGVQGHHWVQLFAVHAEVVSAGGRTEAEVDLDRVGWRSRRFGGR